MPDDIHDKMMAAEAKPEPAADVLKDLTLIGPLHLDDAHGRWMFEPQPDITALEISLIMVLFVHTLNLRKRLGWREYLTRDRSNTLTGIRAVDLARHFKPVE